MQQSQIYFLSRINALTKRFVNTLTNQRVERIDPIYLWRTFSLVVFGSRHGSESTRLVAKKDLSRVLSYRYSSMEDLHWRYAATFYQLHKRTNPAACHTSYLLQWHIFCCYSEHLLPTQEPTYDLPHQK